MILSAHQPRYLPWPGLIAKVRDCDLFVYLDTVIKGDGDWANRNRVKTTTGVQWLTVPVLGPREHRLCDLPIDERGWRRKHLRTLELNYSRAPFWDYYREGIERLINAPARTLADLDYVHLTWTLERFGVKTPVLRASTQTYPFVGTRNDLIVNMCEQLDADTYVFGELGRGYYDPELFAEHGITPTFQDYKPRPYPQLHGPFVPALASVDMLLNVGPAARDYL